MEKGHKMERGGLVKLIAEILIPVLALSGCQSHINSYQKRPLTKAEVRYKEHHKDRNPLKLPPGIEGTLGWGGIWPSSPNPFMFPEPKWRNPTEDIPYEEKATQQNPDYQI